MHHPSIIGRGRGALLSGLLLCSTLLAASTSSAADQVFRHPKLNFELLQPDGYVVTPEKRGLTVRTEDDQRRLRSRRRDAPNRALEIYMHSNPKALTPEDWLRRNKAAANFDNVPGGRYEVIDFANRRVVTYSWCESFCADDFVFASRDGRQIYVLEVSFDRGDEQSRTAFRQIASTFRFSDEPVQAPVPTTPPAPAVITVLSATFGASCGALNGNWTELTGRACNGYPGCDFVVDTRFGDPVPGCAKDFVVDYRCGNEPTVRRAQGREGTTVSFYCGSAPTTPPQPPTGPNAVSVLSATYGGSCGARAGNWTINLARECNGRSTCDFPVDNRFGDPTPGCNKDFVADFRCGNDPTVRRVLGREGTVASFSCLATPPPPPGVGPIAVVAATYGGSCGAYAGNWTQHVARECDGRPRCDFRADNRFGDPARNCNKDLLIDYRCGNDPTVRRVQGVEGNTLTVPCDGTVVPPQPQQPPQPPQPSRPPAPGEAWLYPDCNFGGAPKIVSADMAWIGDDINDRLSAVRLGPGTSVMFFEHGNFGGRSVTVTQDDACLSGRGFNDIASSLRFQAAAPPQPAFPPPGEVWLYSECNFGGTVKTLRADTEYLGNDFNDQLSSIRLGPGTELTLFENGGYAGRTLTLTQDEQCLSNRGFNDVASSARVLQAPLPGEAWLYTDCDYGGTLIRVNADQAYVGDPVNDQISAVRLGPGTSLVLYEHGNYGGRQISISRDERCLMNRNFNDLTSAVRVRQSRR